MVAGGVIVGWLLASRPASAQPPRPQAAAVQDLAREGERALAEGRYADAQKAYEDLRKLTPAIAEVHARLGLIYFQQGKFTEAIVPLREAIRLKPSLPKIGALLAMSLSELGQYDEALPGVTQAFSQTVDPVLRRMAGLHLQRIYLGLRRDLDAADVTLRLSRLYPNDPEVLYHAGRVFANFAYGQTLKLATVAPDSVWLHQAAGEANESQGLHDAALREYRQILSASPRRPGIRFRIGRVLLARAKAQSAADDLMEARQAFEEELKLDPTNAGAAYELAEIQRQSGDLESARANFVHALTHDANFENARVGLARTLIALAKPAEAIPHLQAVVKANPDSDVAYYQLSQAHGMLGNAGEQEKALAEFNRLRSTGRRAVAIPELNLDATPQAIDLEPPK